jgi:maltose alpha-D-glucosyltransferase/alpha-amylase
VREDEDGQSYALAIVQRFVDNQGDGWAWTLNTLGLIVDEGSTPLAPDPATVFAPYAAFARTLGRRLAEMHGVLAERSNNPDFAPEPVKPGDLKAWRDQTAKELDRAIALANAQKDLSEGDAALVQALQDKRTLLCDSLGKLFSHAKTGPRTRIHGDLHLGQVLVAGADVQIIDFEGEPSKSLDQRRSKQSPARDIAGLIRSFDYAAAQVYKTAYLKGSAVVESKLDGLLARFKTEATGALLAGYAEVAGEDSPALDRQLIDIFTLEKAAYEVAYEAANRPDWLPIPLRGLAETADRILEGQVR